MGKLFMYILVSLLVLTVLGFVMGLHKFAYACGFTLGALALGIGFVYSSRDDERYRNNYLFTEE
ncbi:hypothetical protein [Neobacillus terrae]|uniref:hypothetical protein n=1 Tax=Neobacillus terrae TaxID=3034837 RepID=UPI0014087139|nr:hypothetical protein [Neobacillus terrae]NHM34035.1 hypothetical protein [Neobacillus terrae]